MCVVLFSISHFSHACSSLDYIVILFSSQKIILSCCFHELEAIKVHANFKKEPLPPLPMPSWAPQVPVMKVRIKREWYIFILSYMRCSFTLFV